MARNGARISAVILAAGQSARMGRVKQLLPVGGQTVLERVIQTVRRARVDEIVLVLGSSADAIRRALPQDLVEGVRIVVNPQYEEGMSSSVRAGLSAVSPDCDAALAVLADQPFVRPETIGQIVERYRRSDAEIVIPFFNGARGNPVLLDRSVFDEAMELKGDTGFRAIFGRHANGIAQVDVDDNGVLLDIDEQADYERLRDYQG